MKKLSLITIIFLWTINISQAQLIDVLQGHVGLSVFPTNEMLRLQDGKPENLYAGFTPGQIIGVGASKFILDRLQIIGTFELMRTSKANYTLNSTKITGGLKFNILVPDIYRVSPYIIANANFMLINMNQASFTRVYAPPSEFSGENKVQVNEITNQENSYNFFSPVFGASGGGGVDYNFYGPYSIFVEYTYNYNFAKSSGLQNQYTDYNKSQFMFHNMIAGVRIYMY